MKLYLMKTATPYPDLPVVPVYLIQTDEGKNVLVDTGLPAEVFEEHGHVLVNEPKYIVNQLANIGVQPEDIHYLVCTHFDIDHAGSHDVFSNAELIVQRRHYEFARNGAERVEITRPHWDLPALHYRLIDGDYELLPGIQLVETSGHVPGHQAVFVRLPESGPILIVVDAIPRADLNDPDTRDITPVDMDEAGVRASTRKLMALALREQATLVVYGHDSGQWDTLKQAPEFYA